MEHLVSKSFHVNRVVDRKPDTLVSERIATFDGGGPQLGTALVHPKVDHSQARTGYQLDPWCGFDLLVQLEGGLMLVV